MRRLRAWALGVRDGWGQPDELNWSHNVEHLDDGSGRVYGIQDYGATLGQLMRGGHTSQAWREGLPVFRGFVPRDVLTVLSSTLGWAGVGALIVIVGATGLSLSRGCEFEDETFCTWDAREQGNGRGRSFVSVGEFTVYLP